MNLKDEENILIVGKGAQVSALAYKLATTTESGKIFAAPGNGVKSDYYENIDIREDDLSGLLKFVLDNNVGLTIPLSEKSLNSDIVSFFQSNNQNIFGPVKQACVKFFNRISEKKFLYKMHIQCPKFGAFNRPKDLYDYIKDVNYPIIVSGAEKSGLENDMLVCPTISIASKYISDIYKKGEENILIEEYIYGKNFTMYFVTDGYTLLPLSSVSSVKFDNRGFYYKGLGAYSPANISQTTKHSLTYTALRIIHSIERHGAPYVGIIGLEGTLTNDESFVINDIKTCFEDHDVRCVLNTIDDDLIKIFISCINGSFSDEYNEIITNDLYNVSIVKQQTEISNCEYSNLNSYEKKNDKLDFIDSKKYVLTYNASTLSQAKKYLIEDNFQI